MELHQTLPNADDKPSHSVPKNSLDIDVKTGTNHIFYYFDFCPTIDFFVPIEYNGCINRLLGRSMFCEEKKYY